MVTPTDAQIVFSTVPLWSALLAVVVLPEEVVGPFAWAGGFGMLVAGLIASLDKKVDRAPNESN
jgi:drug/metabolite transporter (DMT)-like permease